MKVLCDEHVPTAVVNALQSEGVEAVSVVDALEAGTDDDELLAVASERGFVVLTNDQDSLDRSHHAGVLFYDDQRVEIRELVRAVRNVSEVLDDDHLAGETLFVPDGWI